MIKKQTVFVVGAGASKEFGFPIGSELVTKIAAAIKLRRDEWGSAKIQNELMDRSLALKFADEYKMIDRSWYNEAIGAIEDYIRNISLIPSIDNYLDSRRGNKILETIGKSAIALCLLEFETKCFMHVDHNKKIFNLGSNKNWINQLLLFLNEGVNASNKEKYLNNVSFVTFNYDRCLEHYINHAVNSYFSDSSAETRGQIIKNLRVHHVYGSLGEYNGNFGFKSEHTDHRSYEVHGASKNIITFGERELEEAQSKEISETISNAETVIFLGFSFNEMNMKILTPRRNNSIKKVFFTSFGFSESNAEIIKEQLQKQFARWVGQDVSGEFIEPKVEYQTLTALDFLGHFKNSIIG